MVICYYTMAEDDYMSEGILAQCVALEDKPTLLHTKPLQREHKQYIKKIENAIKNRPLKQIEEERRQEGLTTAIPEDNKGYKLLQKMGYQSGKGLGKRSDGTAKPVDIKIKANNSGLGTEQYTREKKIEYERKKQVSAEQYRSIIMKKKEMQNMKSDFERSCRTCMFLDKKNCSKKEPVVKWYWPKIHTKTASDDEDSDEVDTIDEIESRLEELTRYMRESYNYCLWCGCEYDDYRDLTQDCPGPGRKFHEEDVKGSCEDSDSD